MNSKDRVNARATYGTNWVQWSVVLNSRNMRSVPACPLALVTDHGEFLILIGNELLGWALQIYRRRDHAGDPSSEGPDHGVLVRSIPLKDLWPEDKFKQWQSMLSTDASAQWFAGGMFTFSADSRQLIYKTEWANTVRIKLTLGSVSKE